MTIDGLVPRILAGLGWPDTRRPFVAAVVRISERDQSVDPIAITDRLLSAEARKSFDEAISHPLHEDVAQVLRSLQFVRRDLQDENGS